ncbi:hypothetical protein OIV83_003955 [Microbotryomycetes sp. JL201]|nr:hypothetical protein OIV83_003955 [Microbotryomycetes sp. JL201]
MPNLAERLFAKTVTSGTNPTQWTPAVTSLPVGFSEFKHEYKLAPNGRGIGSVTNIRFECTKGSWCVGTLVVKRHATEAELDRASVGERGPPKYSDEDEGMLLAHGHDQGRTHSNKLQGYATVVVVQRFNKRELAEASRVSCDGDELNQVVSIQTPDSAPMAASISYHVTILLPPTTNRINGFQVDADRFRIQFDPSLQQTLSIAELGIRTADAPVQLDLTGCGTVDIRNENRLNPTRTSLKHHDDLVSGSLSAESINLTCTNGSINGTFQTTVESMSVSTTNFNISGTFKSAKDLTLSTMNAALSGTFTAHGPGGITVELQQTKVDGAKFEAPFGSVRIVNKLASIAAHFTVAKSLLIKTTGFPIDADVRLSPVRTLSRSSSRHRRPSSVMGAPPPSFTSSSTTTDLPTFEDAMQADLDSSRNGSAQQVKVHVQTTEAHLNLTYLNHPVTVSLSSSASTTGGSRVCVEHPAPFGRANRGRPRVSETDPNSSYNENQDEELAGGFVGSFKAVTGGLTSSALVTVLNGSVDLLDFTVNKRSEVAGSMPATFVSTSSQSNPTDTTPGTPVRSRSRPQSSSGRRNPFGSSAAGGGGGSSSSSSAGPPNEQSPGRATSSHARATSTGRTGTDAADGNTLERDVDQMTLANNQRTTQRDLTTAAAAADDNDVVNSVSFAASSTGPAEILFVS